MNSKIEITYQRPEERLGEHFISHIFSVKNEDQDLVVPIQPLGEINQQYMVFLESLKKTTLENGEIYTSDTYALIRLKYPAYNADSLLEGSFIIYKQIHTYIRENNWQYLRAWNYIPDILRHDSGRERYRIFNEGRWNAWQEFGLLKENGEPMRPAATAIGSIGDTLIVEALLTKHSVTHLENPRQTQFVHYSKKWGKKPPVSARGTLLKLSDNTEQIFISGTASLLGEEVVHIGNIAEQTKETLRNIEVLISEKNIKSHGGNTGYKLTDIKGLRVYVKHKEDLAVVKAVVEKLTENTSIMYLHDDVCRPDFLVEIEGYI